MTDQNISRTKRSSQAIDNFSFDEDFLVKVTELVRRNSTGTAIEYFNPATEEKQDTQNDAIRLLSRIVKLLESNAVVDIAGRQKMHLETVANTAFGVVLNSSSTTTPIPTVNAPTAGVPTQASTTVWIPVMAGPVDQRFLIIDQARNTYANSIRSKLTF